MQHKRNTFVLALVAIVALFVLPLFSSNVSAQDVTVCVRTIDGGEVEFSVGEVYDAPSGTSYRCLESGRWQIVQPPVIASFALEEDVEELTYRRGTRTFSNMPIDSLPFTFPVSGQVDETAGTVTFEIGTDTFVIEIEDQLQEIELAESAALVQPAALALEPGLPGQSDDGRTCTSVLYTYPARTDLVLYEFEVQSEVPQANDWYTPGNQTIIVIEQAILPEERSAYAPGYGSAFGYYLDREGCEDFNILDDMTTYAYSRLDQGASGVIVDVSTGSPVFYRVTRNAGEPLRTPIVLTTDTQAATLWANYLASRVNGTPILDATASAIPAGTTCTVSLRNSAVVRSAPLLSASIVARDGFFTVTSQVQGDEFADSTTWWQTSEGYFVHSEVVNIVDNCALLGTTASPQTVAPVVVQPAAPASCAPAVEQAVADGRTVTGPANIEAWEPVSGNVVIPDGVSVTGYKGAVWAYSSQACAEADLRSSGKTYTVYGQEGGL